MPAWTPPKQDWNVNDIVTAQDMNDIGANLAHLKQKARAVVNWTNLSVGPSSFTAIRSVTITTQGGPLLMGFSTAAHGSANLSAYFDYGVDGIRKPVHAANGSYEVPITTQASAISGTMLYLDVSAGTHTVTLELRLSTGWLTMGIGTFWVVEL